MNSTHLHTQTTQLIWEERGPCPVFASYTMAFALQLSKKHGKTSVRVVAWLCTKVTGIAYGSISSIFCGLLLGSVSDALCLSFISPCYEK